MKLSCLLKHRFTRKLEFTPLVDDEDMSKIRVVDINTCSRCGHIKRTEEIVPFQWIAEDD